MSNNHKLWDQWRWLEASQCMKAFRFLLVAQGERWKGVRTLRRTLLLAEACSRGCERALFFSGFLFFSPWIWSSGPSDLPVSAFCCACAPSLSCGLPPSLPHCPFLYFLLPGLLSSPQGKGEKVLYGPDEWTLFEGRRSGRSVGTEKNKKGKEESVAPATGGRSVRSPSLSYCSSPCCPSSLSLPLLVCRSSRIWGKHTHRHTGSA